MEQQTQLDPALWIYGGAILALLLISAFFSGSETALTGSSRAKLHAMADRGSRGAKVALRITEDSERLIGALLLGNNIANILSASLATAVLTRAFGETGVVIATAVMTVLVLIFAEVLPKTYAITYPEAVASRVSVGVWFLMRLLSPILALVQGIVRLVLLLFGVRTDPNSHLFSVHEEIAGTLALAHSEGTVQKEDRDRLLGALDLGDRTVDEIMLHRSKIAMIDGDAAPADIISKVLASPHSRLPVYRGEPENILGVVHAKDLLRAVEKSLRADGMQNGTMRGFDILSVAKPPYFVPETTTLDEQMRAFLKSRTHFALVVDEYGALQGLLTLEDILEEIVGEIADEFDIDAEHQIKPGEGGDYIVDGVTTIRDLNRATDWNLPDDEANTIAGLVIHEAQMIPTEGQVFSFHGFRFEVLSRKDNRITRLKIRPL